MNIVRFVMLALWAFAFYLATHPGALDSILN